MKYGALVSIHDVMPGTFDRVAAIIQRLEAWKVAPVTLLVVPGQDWEPGQVERLHALSRRGYPLAAHGWVHRTRPRRLYHRIHSWLISRDVAEHLDLDSDGVLALLERSKAWFGENGLPVPEFYVPPAWALGPISGKDLARAPFRIIETTRGVLFPGRPARRLKLPLAGFEADTMLREAFLRRWNAYQARAAERSGRPLRISIHPDDPQLRVADQMEELLKDAWQFVGYDVLTPATAD